MKHLILLTFLTACQPTVPALEIEAEVSCEGDGCPQDFLPLCNLCGSVEFDLDEGTVRVPRGLLDETPLAVFTVLYGGAAACDLQDVVVDEPVEVPSFAGDTLYTIDGAGDIATVMTPASEAPDTRVFTYTVQDATYTEAHTLVIREDLTVDPYSTGLCCGVGSSPGPASLVVFVPLLLLVPRRRRV